MKKLTKKILSLFLGAMMIITGIPAVLVSAANYSTDWNSHTEPSRTLSYKSSAVMKGDDVKWLQCAINDLIINGDKNGNKLSATKLDVDGCLGPASNTAIRKFQSKYSLSVDGCFGPASRTKMKNVLKSKSCIHSWTTYRTEKSCTCTASGIVIEKCTKCLQTRTTYPNPLGHNIVEKTKNGFTVKSCSRCGYVKSDEKKVIANKLKENSFTQTQINSIIADLGIMYSSDNFTDKEKDMISKIGKWSSIAGKITGNDKYNDLEELCEYINLIKNLKTIFRSDSVDYQRLNSTLDALYFLTGKTEGGSIYQYGINTIKKQLPDVLNSIQKNNIRFSVADWATLDIKVNGKNIKEMTKNELTNNKTAVEQALRNHYTYVPKYKSLYTADNYVNLFMALKEYSFIYNMYFDSVLEMVEREL